MRRRTPFTVAILSGLACMPAGGCSGPDRNYDPSGGSDGGGALGQGGKSGSSGGVTSTKGGATSGGATSGGAVGEGGAGGIGVVSEGGVGAGGASEGGAGGGTIVEGGAGGVVGIGSSGAAGEAGASNGTGGAACTSGSKSCTGDVPTICSSAGVWVEEPACSTAVLNATTPVCGRGACDYGSCTGAFQDCDTNRGNGCESNKNTDSLNCGSCGQSCASITKNTTSPACNGSGACDYVGCAANFQDCDTVRANGCESSKNTDSLNCGGCGRNCGTLVKNASAPVCNGAGACEYTACSANFQDCDSNRANGCESDKTADLANCGSCGRNCTTLVKGSTGAVCSAGNCDYSACTGGALDCNGVRSDGCERPATAGVAGYTGAFATGSGSSANYLLGHQITVPCSILAGWGVISKAAGPHLIMALYKDNVGVPGALVASSPVITLTGASQTAAASQVVLAAGTYWLMGVFDTLANIGREDGTATQIDYISFTYGAALPATFPTPVTYGGGHFNYFLTLQ